MARRNRRQRLPQEPIEVTIESLGHDGRGIAKIDGKVMFVDGALAGETVKALYTKSTVNSMKLKHWKSSAIHRQIVLKLNVNTLAYVVVVALCM